MKVYKTIKGYFYKEYSNGKRKRISKKEYEKLKIKVKNKKGGNSNTPIIPNIDIPRKKKQLIIHGESGPFDSVLGEYRHTFLLPCILLPSSITNSISKYSKYSKFLQNEMKQGLYNDNKYKKLMSGFSLSPKYPKDFLNILKNSNLQKKWWYKVIDYGNIEENSPNKKMKYSQIMLDIYGEMDSINFSNSKTNISKPNNLNSKSFLIINSRDFHTVQSMKDYSSETGMVIYGGDNIPKPSPGPIPPPTPINKSHLDYNYTDYTEIDGVYMSLAINTSDRYKEEILDKIIYDRRQAEYFLEAYLWVSIGTNDQSIIQKAKNILYEKYIKHINIDNYITLIKIEKGEIIKINNYFTPYIFLDATLNVLNIRYDGIIYNHKFYPQMDLIYEASSKSYIEHQKNYKLAMFATMSKNQISPRPITQ